MFNINLKKYTAKLEDALKELKSEKNLLEKENLQQAVDNAPHTIKAEIENNKEMYVVYERKVETINRGVYGVSYIPVNVINEYRIGSFSSSDLAKQAVKHLHKKDILL